MSDHHAPATPPERFETIRDVLGWTARRFSQAGFESPLLDAQLLLCSVLCIDRIRLYTDIDKPLSDKEKTAYRDLIKRRLRGEPVAYLLGQKHWYDLVLSVDSRVLIPRPETETLLDIAFSVTSLKQWSPNLIIDLCTGSGCLAIALARRFANARVIGIDISQDALDVARQNGKTYGLENIVWRQGDLFMESVCHTLKETYGQADLIVANPPYVTEQDWESLSASVKDYEPKLALTFPENGPFLGDAIFRHIQTARLLSPESFFIMELAEKQAYRVFPQTAGPAHLANQPAWLYPINTWFSIKDLANRERFLATINTPLLFN